MCGIGQSHIVVIDNSLTAIEIVLVSTCACSIPSGKTYVVFENKPQTHTCTNNNREGS